MEHHKIPMVGGWDFQNPNEGSKKTDRAQISVPPFWDKQGKNRAEIYYCHSLFARFLVGRQAVFREYLAEK